MKNSIKRLTITTVIFWIVIVYVSPSYKYYYEQRYGKGSIAEALKEILFDMEGIGWDLIKR